MCCSAEASHASSSLDSHRHTGLAEQLLVGGVAGASWFHIRRFLDRDTVLEAAQSPRPHSAKSNKALVVLGSRQAQTGRDDLV